MVNEAEDKPADGAKPLLEFPTDYPIRIVGRPSSEFRARVHAVVLRHAPDVEADRISERPSAQGNFVSISYVIRATSREQIVALANELKDLDDVMMLI